MFSPAKSALNMRLTSYDHCVRSLRNCTGIPHTLLTGMEVSLQTECGLWTINRLTLTGKRILLITFHFPPRFYDTPQTNGSHEEYPPQAKRATSSLFLNPSPFLYPLPSNASLFDYGHPYPSYHGNHEGGFERRDGEL